MKKIKWILVMVVLFVSGMIIPAKAQNIETMELISHVDNSGSGLSLERTDVLGEAENFEGCVKHVGGLAGSKPVIMYYCKGGEKISNQTAVVPMGYIITRIYDIKVSNPKIATAKAKKVNGNYRLCITVKKAGKFTVYYTAESKDGGTGRYSVNYHFKKYTCPVSSIKIGKKNLTAKYKKSIHITGKPISGNLNIKLKKGWKIKDYYTFNLNTYGNGNPKDMGKIKKFKNTRIKVKKNERLVIRLQKGGKQMNLMYDAVK